MASGKKFNVWIAYSDLFSNLAVFLFISAFGMLAAIGSSNLPGVIVPPSHLAPTPTCSPNSADFDKALLADGSDTKRSRFKPSVFDASRDQDCVNKFELEDMGFPAQKWTVKSLRDSQGRNLGRNRDKILLHQVCDQLWAAATRQDLFDKHGHITIVATDTLSTSGICEKNENLPPKIRPAITINAWVESDDALFLQCDLKMGSAKNRAEVPPECRSLRGDYADCLAESRGSAPCTELRNEALQKQNPVEYDQKDCLDKFAAKRAESLYSYCRDAVRSSSLLINRIGEVGGAVLPEAMRAAKGPDFMALRRIWLERVRYRGISPENPLRTGPPKAVDPVYLIVQFDAQRPNG